MNHTEYHPAVWELDLLRDEGPHLSVSGDTSRMMSRQDGSSRIWWKATKGKALVQPGKGKNLTITSLPKREDFKLAGIAQMARSNKTTHYTKHRPKHKKTQQISFVINEEWSLFKPENTQYDHISLKSYQKWGGKVYLGQSKAKPLPQKPLVWLWEDTRVHEGWEVTRGSHPSSGNMDWHTLWMLPGKHLWIADWLYWGKSGFYFLQMTTLQTQQTHTHTDLFLECLQHIMWVRTTRTVWWIVFIYSVCSLSRAHFSTTTQPLEWNKKLVAHHINSSY